MIADAQNSQLPESWTIEQRPDGTLLVRVPSRRPYVPPLPDAVFTFRAGDPQFDFWNDQFARQGTGQS
jgi:hypothetical protein